MVGERIMKPLRSDDRCYVVLLPCFALPRTQQPKCLPWLARDGVLCQKKDVLAQKDGEIEHCAVLDAAHVGAVHETKFDFYRNPRQLAHSDERPTARAEGTKEGPSEGTTIYRVVGNPQNQEKNTAGVVHVWANHCSNAITALVPTLLCLRFCSDDKR